MDHRIYLTGLLLATTLTTSAQEQSTADTLTAESLTRNLPEIMVKGSRPIVKAERGMLSYNMPLLLKQMSAENAYEALTRLPGVSEVDGNLQFSGNSVTLIVNGQATTLTQEQVVERLKALPADRLAKAEVMLAAPARYHVRGMAINIVTKDQTGTNQWSGQLVGAVKQSRYTTGAAKGALSLQHGKFGMDVQYQFADGTGYSWLSHTASHPLGDSRVDYADETASKGLGIHHNYRLGMNYAFAKGHRLDVAYTGRWDKNCSTAHTTGQSLSDTHSDSHVYLHNVDVNYSLPFGLNISGSYTYYRTPQQQTLGGTLQAGNGVTANYDQTSVSRQTINRWMVAADQSHTLAHGWGLSYGVKAQFADNVSWQTTREKDGTVLPDATSSVDVNERIWNIYAGFSKEFGKQVSLEASVAAEQYHSPLWNQWRVYPTLNALWTVNSNHLLNLSFSSNSLYPSYWTTMSSVHYSSTYSEVWGNPDLKPFSYYNISLMWQIKHRYTLMAFVNLRPDYSVQLPYQTTERMAVIMKETNFDYERFWGLQASAIFQAGQWLSGNVYAQGMLKHDKSSHFFDLPFDRCHFSVSLGGNASVKLCRTQDLRLIMNPFFQTKSIQGVYDISPVFRMNANLQWASANGKWSVHLNGSNIFNNNYTAQSVQGNQNYHMKMNYNWVDCTLSVIYKFGGFKEKRVHGVDTSRMGH
jgi:hypothetical protein